MTLPVQQQLLPWHVVCKLPASKSQSNAQPMHARNRCTSTPRCTTNFVMLYLYRTVGYTGGLHAACYNTCGLCMQQMHTLPHMQRAAVLWCTCAPVHRQHAACWAMCATPQSFQALQIMMMQHLPNACGKPRTTAVRPKAHTTAVRPGPCHKLLLSTPSQLQSHCQRHCFPPQATHRRVRPNCHAQL